MSLHAELSPEVQERLAQQRRNSTISSILISFLSIILIGFILAFVALKVYVNESPTIVTYQGGSQLDSSLEQVKISDTTPRKPSQSSLSQTRVITAAASSDIAIATPTDFTDVTADFGDGEDFGEGFSDGDDIGDSGGPIGVIPTILKQRCSPEDRLQRLLSSGGNAECETAVVKALDYLKKTQSKDGSWPTGRYNVGYTSLGLLAFLGHCETPASKTYGDTVSNAITYLINVSMKNRGRMVHDPKNAHNVYEHSIAVYALCEALSLSRGFGLNIPNLEETVQKAGQILIDKQNTRGGWSYGYDTSTLGDTSIAGWHMQALKAMSHTGIKFKKLRRAEKKGLDYFELMQARSGGISYNTQNPKDNQLRGDGSSLAAVGALCYQIMGSGNNSVANKAIRLIKSNMITDYTNPGYDLYGHYYAAQVMINKGGSTWKDFNDKSRDILLQNQDKDGSWKMPFGGKKGISGDNATAAYWALPEFEGKHYRTCLAALTLEVYYRFLPSAN